MAFEKGTVPAMTSTLFCGECGAALQTQAASCAVCGHPLDASSLSPTLQAAKTPTPSSTASDETLAAGFLLAQRYRIVSLIGQGGFAQVYKAKDSAQKNRLVAIKQISLRRLSAREIIEATDTYNREVLYLSRLSHKSLPGIYGHFTDADHWYIVMEYIQGKSLEDRLQSLRRGYFSVQKALDIGVSLCEALDYLHLQQYPIIFRDLKPANIMMTRKGRLYLIDFGIARYYQRPQQRKDTAPLGSPGYAAPEQYGKAQTTRQTDIYGLGATLQTLLTGKEPLEFLTGNKLSDYALPQELQALIARMLEREPDKRPRSVEEVKQSLQRLRKSSLMQKMQRTLAFIWHSLIPSTIILLVLYFFFNIAGFISSPLWIPCLLAMLCVFTGRNLYYLLQEKRESASGLNATKILSIVAQRLKSSILYTLIPASLFYFFFAILSAILDGGMKIGEVLFLGVAFLVCIAGIFYFFNWDIHWLLHSIISWRQTRKQRRQNPPLQQQMHRHP